jgi:energy-coupling factor transport system permease protein
MEDFEFLRNITIGQYLPGNSLVHRLDPRTKIIVLLLMVVAITFNISYTANIILLIVSFLYVVLADVPVSYILSGVKPAVPFILLLAAMQLLFYGNQFLPGDVPNVQIFKWGIVNITTGSVQLVIVSALRFLQLMFLASLLTNTTTTTSLTHGMESLMRPLAPLGVPAHELSLVMTIALRFVPIFAEQLEIVMKSQASRGADIAAKGKLQFVQTARQVTALIVPLFIDAFRRAEDLILAMQARCYVGGKGRSHMIQLHFAPMDFAAIGVNLVVMVVMLALRGRFPF